MDKGRLQAFSDGVLAISIAFMVLELKVPHSAGWGVLATHWPVSLRYVMSFVPVAVYGFVRLRRVFAWLPLQYSMICANGGKTSLLAQALGGDWKGKVAVAMYLGGIRWHPLASVGVRGAGVSCLFYATLAAIWFIPDRRIESRIKQ